MNMNDGQVPTDEQFDEYARSAGASLRRPAPSGGFDQVRAARQRQRVTRAAAGGAAVALVAIGGAVVALRGGHETNITTAPDTTPAPATTVVPDPAPTTVPVVAPPSTGSAPASTEPASTEPEAEASSAPTAETPLSDAARAWIDARAADGLTNAQLTQGDGTASVLIATWHPTESRYASAVMLPDGRVVDTPDGMTVQPYGFEMQSVGGRPAFLSTTSDAVVVLSYLDPATGEWATGPDLGLGAVRSESQVLNPLTVEVVGDSLVVGVNAYIRGADDVMSPAPERRGVVVHPDLTVTPIAAPPDGVPMTWSAASGTRALLLFAPNGGSDSVAPVGGRWAYDVASNTWSKISEPDWFSCNDPCDWIGPFEMGDEQLEVTTERGVLVRLPDASIGLYEPVTDRWTRLDDAPFGVALPQTLVMGDQVLVAPMRRFDNGYGPVGVVDLRTGAWTTHQIEFPADVQALIDTWLDATWDIRTDGTVVMLTPATAQRGTSRDPLAVYDPATRTWSAPTADDIEVWTRYPTIFGAEGL